MSDPKFDEFFRAKVIWRRETAASAVDDPRRPISSHASTSCSLSGGVPPGMHIARSKRGITALPTETAGNHGAWSTSARGRSYYRGKTLRSWCRGDVRQRADLD
jgi:hypothetical protein